ncbi:MAG: malate dehydrogenase (quinone) [Thermomicrobiales bacterium]
MTRAPIRVREERVTVSSGRIDEFDVVLIGGGIMSATLGVMLQQVRPDWSIQVYERLLDVGSESSGPWNNAGTGHAAYCEMNYTPQRADGTVDISKALTINEQFHVTRQFWSSLIERGDLPDPSRFVHGVPHMSYVKGDADLAFLRERYALLKEQPLFAEMMYSEDLATIGSWAPLMLEGRSSIGKIAMTRHDGGTDVDFGFVTRSLLASIEAHGGSVKTEHDVTGLRRLPDGRWRVSVLDRGSGGSFEVTARFVFIGAGGRAVELLHDSGIKEAKGYGGFPVSGQFLVCTNPEIIAQHDAKVYGKSQVNAPPMAMPHLDTRMVNGERALLFGPYAGFSPKFLKRGSWMDLFTSVHRDNLITLLTVARKELPLTLYLINEVRQSPDDRIETLRDFIPTARKDDWKLIHAGMRVQTMKRTSRWSGSLEFGTEVVAAKDGSIAGLLGASPGASTAPSIMLNVIQRCFPREYDEWEPKLSQLVPSIGRTLNDDPALLREIDAYTDKALKLA